MKRNRLSPVPFLLQHICDVVNKSLGLFPTNAGVGNRFTVDRIITDLLCAVLNVALDHKTFHYATNIRGITARMKYFLGNSYLLKRLLSGVCVVSIYHYSVI